MTKKVFIALLFCALYLTPTRILAAHKPTPLEYKTLNEDECIAPAPDSFRITSIGGNFITLAWNPAWIGATHTLVVSEKNIMGGWTPLITYSNVPGSSFTVNSLLDGKHYQFGISTNCNSGEPSVLLRNIDGITLIVELVINGRTPKDPIYVNCQGILYPNPDYAWVGFRVSRIDGDDYSSNLFEFEEIQIPGTNNNYSSKIRIKRVELIHPIVAANQFGVWPNSPMPIKSVNPFYMRDEENVDDFEIGRVQVVRHLNPSTLDLCVFNFDPPWDFQNYLFEPLVAIKVESGLLDPPIKEVRSTIVNNEKLKVQSPFKDVLNIFMPDARAEAGDAKFWLINANGQIVLTEHIDQLFDQISIPVGGLTAGLYFLRIETTGEVYIQRVIKTE